MGVRSTDATASSSAQPPAASSTSNLAASTKHKDGEISMFHFRLMHVRT